MSSDSSDNSDNSSDKLRRLENGNWRMFINPSNGLEYSEAYARMMQGLFEEATADAVTLEPGRAVEVGTKCQDVFHNGKRYCVKISIEIGLPDTKSLA